MNLYIDMALVPIAIVGVTAMGSGCKATLEPIMNFDEDASTQGSDSWTDEFDSSVVDSGVAETGVAETGVAETGVAETGVAETGVAETGVAETGVAETGVAESGSDTDTGKSGSDGGGTWIDRTVATTAASLDWNDVASDSTGTHLVAVTGIGGFPPDGNIWTSEDAGHTWTNRTNGTRASGQDWTSVASDSTGTYLVAVTYVIGVTQSETSQAGIWTSANAGVTWTQRITVVDNSPYVLGPTVASDSTGTHLVLAAGDVWTSSDSGATWTDQTAGTSAGARAWVDMASDSTGAHLVGATAYSDIWTSSDSGSSWTNRTTGTAASGAAWQGVATDSTGTRFVAISQPSAASTGTGLVGGDIWVSADSGTTWTNRTQGTAASGATGIVWEAVASDATGTHLVAASAHGSSNDIWSSADSGMTWINETAGTAASGQQWGAVASDTTGSHLVAVSNDPSGGGGICCQGDIWTN